MKASIQIVKIIIFSLLLLLFTYPCFSFGNESVERINSAVISWVAEYYQTSCEYLSISSEKNVSYRKDSFLSQCFFINQIDRQDYDSLSVIIYTTGVNFGDFDFDKILIQKKYKDGHSQFEFIWDNPKDIDQIIKIVDFFEKYDSFSDQVKLECITRAVIIYENTKYK